MQNKLLAMPVPTSMLMLILGTKIQVKKIEFQHYFNPLMPGGNKKVTHI